MSSLRSLRNKLRSLEEDVDQLEGRTAGGHVRPILHLRLDDDGERYESCETGVVFERAEELRSKPYPRRLVLFLSASMRREQAERLAPLFADDPGGVELMDGETWSLETRAWQKRRPDWRSDDDEDSGRKVDDDDPDDLPPVPRRRPDRDLSVDVPYGSRWV